MKVRELIERLQMLDPELRVLAQKDEEGNGYKQVIGVDEDAYVDKTVANHYCVEDVYSHHDAICEDLGNTVEQVAVLY